MPHRITVVTLCVALMTLWRLRASFSAPQEPIGAAESDPVNHAVFPRRLLSFQVCNGFTNQRLSIIYAAIIAKEMGRSLYLPRLLLEGTQHDTSKATTLINSEATDFGTFYDVDAFVIGMKAAGVRVFGEEVHPRLAAKRVVRVLSQELQSLLEFGDSKPYKSAAHLSIECPLFKLDAAVVGRHRELVESVLSSLVPAPAQRAKVDELKTALNESGHYNVLHLRVERDWINHCKKWVSDRGVCLAEDVVRAIGEHLDLKGVSRGTPLYVACDLLVVDPDLLNAGMKSLKAMGYTKVTLQGRHKKRKSKQGREASDSELSREIRAMHAYYLGMESSKYIGNSVSTFSALLLLERQTQNNWSTYYNMGGIPHMYWSTYEMDNRFPRDAGVVPYNLPYVRQSYHDLVAFAMQTPGLHFGAVYGPADQGALNQFYKDEMRSMCSLPEALNAKPYKLGDLESLDDVLNLHFHGPKPKHYFDFANERAVFERRRRR